MTTGSQWAIFRWTELRRVLIALGIGTSGGWLLHAIHAPVPWMLGAMLATSAAAIRGVPISIPRGLRNAFVPVLGVMFGSAIDVHRLPSPELLGLVALLVVAYLVFTIGLGYLYFCRVGLDRTSSFFASVPGSFSEIVLVADSLGADIRSVALVHSARLVIAIPIISFGLQTVIGIDATGIGFSRSEPLELSGLAILAVCGVGGYALARLIRMPAPQMFGPLFLSAFAHGAGWINGAPPAWAVASAQVLLGTFTGAKFSGVSVREVGRVIILSAVWALLLMIIIAAFTAVAARLSRQPVIDVLLAFSPGGFAEVSMVAMAAGAGLGLVTAAHFMRMVLVILVIPLLIGLVPHSRKRAIVPSQEHAD